jgi:hypothetical protein
VIGVGENMSREDLVEIKVKVYYVNCPVCDRICYGLSSDEAKEKLINHMNEKHG